MKNPEFVQIKEKRYKINTSYLVALECDKIAKDEKIGGYERTLAIIYKLFGEDGLNAHENYAELLELAKRYINIGKVSKAEKTQNKKPDMDFEKDMHYIKASFMYDYGIDLDKNPDMHWWTFYGLLEGLSNSEFGNCCILNRVRNLRNVDLSKIKDSKEREKIAKAQSEVALEQEKPQLTEQQIRNCEKIYKLIGL